jgi:ADP-ribose pyrophosphatase
MRCDFYSPPCDFSVDVQGDAAVGSTWETTMTATAWKVLSSHNAFDHRWYVVRRDILQLPDGTIVDDYFVSVRPDVVVVVAVNRSGDMIMVRQYKHGAREVTLEFPAGTFKGEPPETAALRELEEETGYVPDRIEYLGRCWDDASKNTNTVHMFLALDCELRGQQKLERLEAAAGLEVLLMPFDRVAQALDSGDIAAMSSVAAGYRAMRRLSTCGGR